MMTRARGGALWSPTRRARKMLATSYTTLIGLSVLSIFLLPILFTVVTAVKTKAQFQDPKSRFLPRVPVTHTYEGKDYPLYEVPVEGATRQLALIKKLRISSGQGYATFESTFIDPQNPAAGPIKTDLNWFLLKPVYRVQATPDNFPIAWEQINLGLLFRNTFIIAIAGTFGALISSVCVAYGFARFRVPGVNTLFMILIGTIILPIQITLIPQYIFFRAIGWGSTWWPLIIPHFFSNAYNVFLLRQYFKGIPKDLDEAAIIDGASPWQVLRYVILPQSVPAITAVSLFHFFWAWNDFFAPLIYLQGRPDLYTISIGMTQFTNIFNTQPGLAMAASLMTIAVPVVIFFLAQRIFMQGIVITGVEK